MRNVLKSVTNVQRLLSVDIKLLIKSTIVEVKKCCVVCTHSLKNLPLFAMKSES